ncbi:hypothetical protein ZWY2020_027147 [Hordeum vulgare]|nr:hypothetical protein ZWY2020_027147 [Hordeum vulgare]
MLGKNDLFREIHLRLSFPNCLVRAAILSKRWLRLHASDPGFLHLFREHHPHRLLGFCVNNDARYQFVQLEQSRELATLSRCVAFSCNVAFGCRKPGIGHSRNSRLIATLFGFAGESEVVLPPYPLPGIDREVFPGGVFTKEL